MDQYFTMNNYLPIVLKHTKINNNSTHFIRRKNFLNGLQNALNILNGLERCLQKTSKYEKKLLRCKSSHSHTHGGDWFPPEPTEGKETKVSDADEKSNTKSSRNQVEQAESWPTVSIVCLQYQYEELSERYEALLRAYDERCGVLNERDRTVARLHCRTDSAHAQLIRAHEALLSIGERYLILRRKKIMQKKWYEERLEALKRIVQDVTAEVERLGLGLEDQFYETMEPEQDIDTPLLVSEIRKCNLLFLENLHLKAHMEGVTTGDATLETS